MKKDRRLLEHILLDVCDILEFTKDLSCVREMMADKKVYKAVCMSIINIGQAAYELSSSFKQAHAGVPWSAIIGMRNRTAHGYHLLDPEAVWEASQSDIPALKEYIVRILNSAEEPPEN